MKSDITMIKEPVDGEVSDKHAGIQGHGQGQGQKDMCISQRNFGSAGNLTRPKEGCRIALLYCGSARRIRCLDSRLFDLRKPTSCESFNGSYRTAWLSEPRAMSLIAMGSHVASRLPEGPKVSGEFHEVSRG